MRIKESIMFLVVLVKIMTKYFVVTPIIEANVFDF